LPIVDSSEGFGLVESSYSTTFKGLIEMKEEPEDEDIQKQLKIDPSLLHLPLSSGSSASIHQDNTILMSD
jgi:hypothetical protein